MDTVAPLPTTTDELKDLLEENLKVAKENHRLLKAMRRDAFIGGLVKTIVWLVLIGLSFYFSFKFLEPYLGLLEGMQGGSGGYQDLFEQYKGFLGQ